MMKEVVMSTQVSPLKSVHSRSTDKYSLLKHRNFDFALFRGGDGADAYIKSDF